jgi:DNA-binding Lrp family transcriptional regulator
MEDSRLSCHKIAIRLKISVGTVQKRIEDLQNGGILKGYTAVLDPVKLGYTMTTAIFVQAESGYLDDLKNVIAKATNVTSMYETTGDFDLLLIAKFKESSDLISFIKQLLVSPHVRRTFTDIVLEIIKEDSSSLVTG